MHYTYYKTETIISKQLQIGYKCLQFNYSFVIIVDICAWVWYHVLRGRETDNSLTKFN